MSSGRLAYEAYVAAKGGNYPKWWMLPKATRESWESVAAGADTRRKP